MQYARGYHDDLGRLLTLLESLIVRMDTKSISNAQKFIIAVFIVHAHAGIMEGCVTVEIAEAP